MAKEKMYELYEKSKFVMTGTIKEIIKFTGYSQSYIYQSIITESRTKRQRNNRYQIYPINSLFIEFENGKSITLEKPNEIAEKIKIDRYRLSTEIKRRVNSGLYTIEEAISKPLNKRTKWKELILALYKGEEFICDGTIYEISEKTGYTYGYLRNLVHGITQSKTNNGMYIVKLDEDGDDI